MPNAPCGGALDIIYVQCYIRKIRDCGAHLFLASLGFAEKPGMLPETDSHGGFGGRESAGECLSVPV